MLPSRPKIIFLITEDWYFWSHRLDLARAARDSGFQVCIATRVQQHGNRIESEGFTLFPITLVRRSRNPVIELLAVAELARLYEREKPDVVHHVAIKPILYGTIAAQMTKIPVIVNAFAGLGYTFLERGGDFSAIRSILPGILRVILRGSRGYSIFQNPDDRDALVRARIVSKGESCIIRGAGVNLKEFTARIEPETEPIVILASRLLWDKGVGDFVDSARILRAKGSKARFVLVGQPDYQNPAGIPTNQISEWVESGVVEWWGYRSDMDTVLSKASIVVLPSYREGLPKILLEACACSRPIIATNVPGCREVVRPLENGLLVPAKDPQSLAGAISQLLDNKDLRVAMGVRAREIVENEFSSDVIAAQTLNVYRHLLGGYTS